MADTRIHLHEPDCPDALLQAMLDHRDGLPDDYALAEPRSTGRSPSATAGDLPSSVREPVRKAMEGIYRS